MSPARSIVVRYRAEGHIRFQLPSIFCQPEALQALVAGLRRMDGVYRVDAYPRQGKLAIRYLEGVANAKTVASALFDLACALEQAQDPTAEAQALQAHSGDSLEDPGNNPDNSLKDRLRLVLTPEREQLAVDFCTDLLVLYLIKMHWHLVMDHWIKRPWAFRGEWMATLYLIFLLVRSKRPK